MNRVLLLTFWMLLPFAQPIPVRAQDQATGEVARLIATRLDEAEQDLHKLDNRVPPLIEQTRQLLDRVQSLKSALERPPIPKPPTPEVKQVEFRPPLMHVATGKTRYALHCEESQLFVVDFTELRAGKGHFELKMIGGQQKVVRKLGHTGESIARLAEPDSEFQKLLRSLPDPAKQTIQFAVYHDSFDIFREARRLLWATGVREVGWVPMAAGELVGFSSGRAGSD